MDEIKPKTVRELVEFTLNGITEVEKQAIAEDILLFAYIENDEALVPVAKVFDVLINHQRGKAYTENSEEIDSLTCNE
jgi:tetrahydromethanopterin S-methyltransferase subunit H